MKPTAQTIQAMLPDLRLIEAELDRLVADKALTREQTYEALCKLWDSLTHDGRSALRELMFLRFAGIRLPVVTT
jgi:hypothetical protein